MKEMVEPHQHIIELAKQAMIECDVEPMIKPIRGGTDGARLSFAGAAHVQHIFTAAITSTVFMSSLPFKVWNR